MNRRSWMKALLAIPGVGMLAAKITKGKPNAHEHHAFPDLCTAVRELMSLVQQCASDDYWEECHWQAGLDMRSKWYSEGTTILAAAGVGAVNQKYADGFSMGGLEANVARFDDPPTNRIQRISNSAKLFHGGDLIGVIYTQTRQKAPGSTVLLCHPVHPTADSLLEFYPGHIKPTPVGGDWTIAKARA